MAFRKIRSFLFNFFHFNKQERNGIFVLCIIIMVLIFVRLSMPYFTGDSDSIELISLNVQPALTDEKIQEQTPFTKKEQKEHKISGQRFVFNPNTITEADAQKLGFSKKLCSTLVNFRNKGGKFFKPDDLKKLYGLSPELYEQIESYILIPNTKSAYRHDSVFAHAPRVYEKKTTTKEPVEINSADSLSIVFLKGIGPGFTKRIIKYRTMLGGFHSINQLKEVYGMTDSVFVLLSAQIKLDANNITKLPINAIDFNSLRRHPYFNFQLAQAVINYRNKHGKLSKEDIVGLGVFSEEKLKLILPYLSY
jgi:competence protein ComEA